MKLYLQIVLVVFVSLLFLQCNEKDNSEFNKPDVKIFVQQIQSGRYTVESPSGYVEVPAFKKDDISSLLFYAQDHTPVKDFPVNPISTDTNESYRLSQCLLWTIEKIRIGTYPSLTPSLMKKDSITGKYNLVTNLADINEVWLLYNNWWQMVESHASVNDSSDYYASNPLLGTAYLWY